MLPIVTAAQMQRIDQTCIEDLGIAANVLMENAGVAVLRLLEQRYGDVAGQRVHILVGRGNNGGDGLVLARHLLNRGAKVKVYLMGQEEELSDLCRHNFTLYNKLGGSLLQIDQESIPKVRFALSHADIVVDALLGIGGEGGLRGLYGELADRVNGIAAPVLSIDVPSGVDASTGAVSGKSIVADCTAALAFLKTGLLLHPGAELAGEVKVLDIGIPTALAAHIDCFFSGKGIMNLLPSRPVNSHKGTFGHALVIAGSRSMAGAAALSAEAVLRSGAGMVTIAVPESIASRFPPGEAMIIPVPETEAGVLAEAGVEVLRRALNGKSLVVLGPGLGQGDEVSDVIQAILHTWNGPLVLDADGLNNLAAQHGALKRFPGKRRRKWVLTPHPGEMARLTGLPVEQIDRQRISIATKFAQEWGVTLLLKGAPTVIARGADVAFDGAARSYVNCSGNQGMATAGMGDVLSGIIGGLICQGASPFAAAATAAYVHGRAAEVIAQQRGCRSLIASDLFSALGTVLD